MQSNQPVNTDQDNNIVPLPSPRGSKDGWIYENFRNLFDHFAKEKAVTDERLAAFAREWEEAETRLDEIDSKTRNLATSTDRLIQKTNSLASSSELFATEFHSVSTFRQRPIKTEFTE